VKRFCFKGRVRGSELASDLKVILKLAGEPIVWPESIEVIEETGSSTL
jgi:hypothetical protein